MKCSRVLIFSLAASACGPTVDAVRVTSEHAIVGGVLDTGDPAIVEVLVDGGGECTGSLIAPRVVLTAAHCVVDLPATTAFGVFLGADDTQPGDSVAATAFAHPAYSTVNDDTTDVAVLVLDEPLAIAPIPYLSTPLSRDLIGEPVRVVGYGDNTVQDPTSGFGIKREGTASLNDFDNDWVYVGDAALNQCFGDSGGPALMIIDGVETIVGVDSWSDSDNCDVENANTKIDAYAAFIAEHVAAAEGEGEGEPAEGEGDDGEGEGDEGEGEGHEGEGEGDDDPPPPVGCAGAGLDVSALALLLALRRRR